MSGTVWALMREFPEALAVGTLVSAGCAMLGVYVILKRVVFIGIALSELAVCGMVLAFMVHAPPFVGAAALTLPAVGFLSAPYEDRRVPRDAMLGVLFVMAGAMAILLVAHSGVGLIEIKSRLYGDLILASHADLAVAAGVFLPVMIAQGVWSRPILYAFLDRDAFRVLGGRPRIWEGLLFLLLGIAVSAASKTSGALLVFGYLVLPPVTALMLFRRMPRALGAAAACAVSATWIGLWISFAFDLPTNPTICVAAGAQLALAGAARFTVRRARARRATGRAGRAGPAPAGRVRRSAPPAPAAAASSSAAPARTTA
jgi:ABC-type Mn2+/Zn2+ transport system permease subunit